MDAIEAELFLDRPVSRVRRGHHSRHAAAADSRVQNRILRSHCTMSAADFAPLRAYDGIRLLGPSQGAHCAQTDALFAVCPLCGARSKHTRLRPKFFKFPRGLREHLNNAHDDLPTAERARLLVDAEGGAISDCEAHLRALAASAASASAASSSRKTEADTHTPASTPTPLRVPASATPSAPQMSVQSSLHPCLVAARDGNLDALRAWSIIEVNRVFDRHGSSALHWAAGGGHLNIVRYLIEGDASEASSASDAVLADPCMRAARSRLARDDGKTPLHWAARNGHVAVIEYVGRFRACRTFHPLHPNQNVRSSISIFSILTQIPARSRCADRYSDE
jgi:hypothetical protein